jgi:hypothetical protein
VGEREKIWRWWDDNIEIDITDGDYEGVDCIDLAEDRDRWRDFVNTVMNICVLKQKQVKQSRYRPVVAQRVPGS